MKLLSFCQSAIVLAMVAVATVAQAQPETDAAALCQLQDERMADIEVLQESLKGRNESPRVVWFEAFVERDQSRARQIGILSAKLEAARATERKATSTASLPAWLQSRIDLLAGIDAVREQASQLPAEQRGILFAQWEQANAAQLSAIQQQITAESLATMAQTPTTLPVTGHPPVRFTSPIPWNAPAQPNLEAITP